MVSVPLVKIFSLTMKTLSKPVAKRIKSEAERQPRLRGVLHDMGQLTNSLSLRVDIWMAGHTTTKIKLMEERKAVTAGGDLLAELIIYAMAAGLAVWEYRYSANEKERKDAAAKIKRKQEQKELTEALETINERLLTLETGIKSIASAADRSPISPADDGTTRRGSQWRWLSFLGGWGGDRSDLRSGNGSRTDGRGDIVKNGPGFSSSFVE